MPLETVSARILLARQYFGFGDWLMMASAIKQIRAIYPAVETDVDVTNIRGNNQICREAVELFDAGARLVTYPAHSQYAGYVDHVAYPVYGDYHLIESMVEHVLVQCPTLDHTRWSPAVGRAVPRAKYIGLEVPYVTANKPYVVMPAHGVLSTSRHKEWGPANFGALAEMLKLDGYTIVQTGKGGDLRLRAASDWFFQRPLADLVGLIRGSAFVVSLENGLSHLAGHLQWPCVTLYLHRQLTRPVHTMYENQIPIEGEPGLLTAGAVYEQIRKVLTGLWERKA